MRAKDVHAGQWYASGRKYDNFEPVYVVSLVNHTLDKKMLKRTPDQKGYRSRTSFYGDTGLLGIVLADRYGDVRKRVTEAEKWATEGGKSANRPAAMALVESIAATVLANLSESGGTLTQTQLRDILGDSGVKVAIWLPRDLAGPYVDAIHEKNAEDERRRAASEQRDNAYRKLQDEAEEINKKASALGLPGGASAGNAMVAVRLTGDQYVALLDEIARLRALTN